jgi:hypothetical protein
MRKGSSCAVRPVVKILDDHRIWTRTGDWARPLSDGFGVAEYKLRVETYGPGMQVV